MSIVGSANPTSVSGPTVAPPSSLPTNTNTVWSTPMRDLGAHVRCSSLTTLQDALIGGRVHENMNLIAVVLGGPASNPTVISASQIYNGIVGVSVGTNSVATGSFTFDTVENILSWFPQVRTGDVVMFWILNASENAANMYTNNPNETMVTGNGGNAMITGPNTLVPVLMRFYNVPPVGGGSSSISFYASFGTYGFLNNQQNFGAISYQNTIYSPSAITSTSLDSTTGTLSATSVTPSAAATAATLPGSSTLIAAFLATGLLELTAGTGSSTAVDAAYNIPTDTAVNYITQIQGSSSTVPYAGTQVVLRVFNNSGYAATLVGGTGVTVVGGALASGVGADLILVLTDTNSGEQTVTIYVM